MAGLNSFKIRSFESWCVLPQTQLIPEVQSNRVDDQTPLNQPSTSGHRQHRRCLQEMQSDHSTPRLVSAIVKKMLSLLEEVKCRVSHYTKLLNLVIKKTEQNERDSANNADLPEGVALPIWSTEQMHVVEQRLGNETTVIKLESLNLY
ncbi:Hypothetical predicted protein [Mytilus galloprovincialis]|uniref:Uncharacterized protein n=1 Tax=Mytilus galloprovincialis TaxID=29158 RepID=A0A8B6FY75_MYTGA|nr:Hypothetical predicted protein [Mytilus galloprovincialis]